MQRIWGITRTIKDSMTSQLPQEMQAGFVARNIKHNVYWFSILPFLNIITQMMCYVIYLYIYPAVYPERTQLDKGMFLAFTCVYIVANAIFAALFLRLRRRLEHTDRPLVLAQRLVLVFLVLYVVFEGFETLMEVQISGNIYRFLATFFVTSFLPVVPRWQKLGVITLYTAVVEAGLVYLRANGYTGGAFYAEIIIVFWLVCAVLSMVVYTNSQKSYKLQTELVLANEKLQRMTVEDPLTGLANRRAIASYIAQIWDECKRNSSAVNVIMIDIDRFKKYNDFYGHQKGDECLLAVAHEIQARFNRSLDMVGRYGGEEFLIILPYTSRDGLQKQAEAIRKAVEDLQIPHEAAGNKNKIVTISVGVASVVPGIHEGYERVVKLADDALYTAKRQGRNCVCHAPI